MFTGGCLNKKCNDRKNRKLLAIFLLFIFLSNFFFLMKNVAIWKDWSWSSNTLATWCEELPHLKRSWCWERLKAGGEVDNRGWDGWMASPTQWTWVWVNSGSWWWTERPGVLQSMGSQRVGHDWVTELNWFSSHWELIHKTTLWGIHLNKL